MTPTQPGTLTSAIKTVQTWAKYNPRTAEDIGVAALLDALLAREAQGGETCEMAYQRGKHDASKLIASAFRKTFDDASLDGMAEIIKTKFRTEAHCRIEEEIARLEAPPEKGAQQG